MAARLDGDAASTPAESKAVYLANQITIGREVAVKIILPPLSNQPDFIRHFETRAQHIARLEHLHIVPLYDYWRDPDGAYLVTRWMRGGNLQNSIAQGPYDLQAAARVLEQVTSALEMAHRSGLVHGAIQPSNVMLDEEGNAYLSDFSMAIEGFRSGASSADLETVGANDYQAPELARKELLSPLSDIYSLGVMVYEVLAGQPPFADVPEVERLFYRLDEPLPQITTLEDSAQEAVNQVIQKATAKNPAKRYQDALQLVAAFQEATGETPVDESLS